MVDRLSNLVSIFDTPDLDFRGNRAEGDDLLGDAYEYLMRHFATESGKSKGQFYTPAEVSRIMAKVIGVGGVKSDNQTLTARGSFLLARRFERAIELAAGVPKADAEPVRALVAFERCHWFALPDRRQGRPARASDATPTQLLNCPQNRSRKAPKHSRQLAASASTVLSSPLFSG